MRKIKFRAKAMSKKNTNWHYGLVRSIAKDGTGFIQDQNRNCIHINIETLGQYTGLKDRNGKEIYEGDILEYGTGYRESVKYRNGCFMAIGRQSCNYLYSSVGRYSLVVIGNIYENPELLEVQND